jgi:GGDEF domain-containing protein
VSAPHLIDAQDLHVTVSMGISVYPIDGADAETLIKNADLALFHSKAYGRSNHQFYRPNMRARTTDARSAATL